MKMKEIAEKVRNVVSRKMGNDNVEIVFSPSNDERSYHVSSEKLKRELGFVAQYSVEDAVSDLCNAFIEGKIPDPADERYYNIKTMQKLRLR